MWQHTFRSEINTSNICVAKCTYNKTKNKKPVAPVSPRTPAANPPEIDIMVRTNAID